MDISINDPNDPMNTELKPVFIRDYTVAESIQQLFNRINASEDAQGSMGALLGSQEEIEEIQNRDKTVIGVLLETEEKIDAFIPSEKEDIQSIVSTNLLFYGEG